MNYTVQINNLVLSKQDLERFLQRERWQFESVWTSGRQPGCAVVQFISSDAAELFVRRMQMKWRVEWFYKRRREQ
jgi:hypothetical protein